MNYPWHEAVYQTVMQRRTEGTLPSAMAVICDEGWGGTALLSQIALSLLEVSPAQSPETFAHPDFRWVVPDGAVIKIDQVRALNEFIVQTSQIAPRKVAAIADAHLLNNNAANTLLKTLEEPPANTHILLGTPHWGRLLPTIRSRCQRFQAAHRIEDAKTWLDQQDVAFKDASFAEHGYAPLPTAEAGSDSVDQWMARLEAANPAPVLDELMKLDIPHFLSRWYRYLVWAQRDRAQRVLLAFAEEINQARLQIETSNAANARLLLERLVYQWRSIKARQRAGQPSAN